MLGCVYVVTTDHYKSRSIFKIGFTTNLIKRLKSFNATRMDDDLFYCVRQWRTIHYSKLEAFLHNHLREHRRKNEFFQVDLSLVEEGAELFATTNGPHFFHEDAVLINAEACGVEYLQTKNMFIFTDPSHTKGGSRIRSATEKEMCEVVAGWLECVDPHKLVRFMSSDALDRLVVIVKQACLARQTPDADDLSMALARLVVA